MSLTFFFFLYIILESIKEKEGNLMIDLHTEFYRIFLNSKKLCYSSFLLKNSIIYNF